MELPAFDNTWRKWDEYSRFHWKPKPYMVCFETGEAIITQASFKPHYRNRKIHTNCDLMITSTADSECPRLKLDLRAPDLEQTKRALLGANHDLLKVYNKPIPKDWLTAGGGKTLLLDTTTRRAVQLRYPQDMHHEAWQSTPGWITANRRYGAVAYLPGQGKPAVASKIDLDVPILLTSDERRALRSLAYGCAAWWTMVDNDINTYAPAWYAQDKYERWRYVYHRPFDTKGEIPEITDLSPEQRLQIVRHGYKRRFTRIVVDQLISCQ